jgi:hypothetical protein
MNCASLEEGILLPVLWVGGAKFDSRQGKGIYLFVTASISALGPTQPPVPWIPWALSLGVKRSGREADRSPPSSAEDKNSWSCTSISPICFQGMVLSEVQTTSSGCGTKLSRGTTLPSPKV